MVARMRQSEQQTTIDTGTKVHRGAIRLFDISATSQTRS